MNIRNTTAKERMLKNIRKALLHKRDNPYPDFEETPLYVEADEELSLDVIFAQRFAANGGNFVYCESEISLIENLIQLAERLKIQTLVATDARLMPFLDQYAFPYSKEIESLEAAENAIVGCEALIARTGSVVLSNAFGSDKRLSMFPKRQIIFAKASQLVQDIMPALATIKAKFGNELPSQLSIVTGLSCSTAIEYSIARGGAGPDELYLFMLEDRF